MCPSFVISAPSLGMISAKIFGVKETRPIAMVSSLMAISRCPKITKLGLTPSDDAE
jgi:hypothetical protein